MCLGRCSWTDPAWMFFSLGKMVMPLAPFKLRALATSSVFGPWELHPSTSVRVLVGHFSITRLPIIMPVGQNSFISGLQRQENHFTSELAFTQLQKRDRKSTRLNSSHRYISYS